MDNFKLILENNIMHIDIFYNIILVCNEKNI